MGFYTHHQHVHRILEIILQYHPVWPPKCICQSLQNLSVQGRGGQDWNIRPPEAHLSIHIWQGEFTVYLRSAFWTKTLETALGTDSSSSAVRSVTKKPSSSCLLDWQVKAT